MQIIDITNPAAPTTTARITSGTAGFYFNSANYVTATQIGNSHYALVMGGSGVTIINITDPANPKPAARVTDANVVGMHLVGQYMQLRLRTADTTHWLQVTGTVQSK